MYEAIKFIYPDILDSQFMLQDDGEGPYFKAWTYPQPQPTQLQIDAALAALAIPSSVTMRQARLALLQGGYLAQVDSLISAMPGIDGDAARITWEFASEVERTSPMVSLMQSQLPLTDQQVSDLFTLAASL